MAYNSRRVEGWWSIGPVYTPPEHRGHGYATALVTHLSEWALASSATGCTLFTDLANPVSNRIYERMGYRRVSACATVAWGGLRHHAEQSESARAFHAETCGWLDRLPTVSRACRIAEGAWIRAADLRD